MYLTNNVLCLCHQEEEEESTFTSPGITTVTRQQSVQEYFTSKSRHCCQNGECSSQSLHSELSSVDNDSRCGHSELDSRCSDPVLKKACTKGTKRKRGGLLHALENGKQPNSKVTARTRMKKRGVEI